MEWTLKELAARLSGELRGDGAICIRGVAGIKEARAGELTFLEKDPENEVDIGNVVFHPDTDELIALLELIWGKGFLSPGGPEAVAAIEAVVTISRTSKTPFTVVDWREPPRVEFPPREGVEG